MTVPKSATGIVWKALDGASSSGTESYHLRLQYPLSYFGMTVVQSLTSGGVVVDLRGAAAATTGSTGEVLITKSTSNASGLTLWSTNSPQPIGKLVVDLTQNQTTAGAASTGTVEVWITGVP